MKPSILLTFLLCLILASTSFAAGYRDTSDGCGLGWQVTKNRTLSATTTRGTTNYVVPPSFGMSSGTMDCESHSIVKSEKEQIYFTEANFEVILAEMSMGEGEFLNAYGQTLGCTDLLKFSKLTQKNFQEIVTHENTKPSNVLKNTKEVLASNGGCQLI